MREIQTTASREQELAGGRRHTLINGDAMAGIRDDLGGEETCGSRTYDSDVAGCDGGKAHHVPVFGMDAQGSVGGKDAPFCKSSIETRSGERTNAMCPSRGGLLIVTPAAWSRSHVA